VPGIFPAGTSISRLYVPKNLSPLIRGRMSSNIECELPAVPTDNTGVPISPLMDLIVAVTLMVPPETGSIEGEIINEVISGGVEFCWATGVWVVGVGVGVGCAFDTTFTDGKVENTGLKPFPSIGPAKLRAYVPRGAVCGITIDPEPLPLASGEMILLKLTPPGPERMAITFGLE